MNKYALLVTADYKFLPGVNALLSGCKHYGNEVDFYLLYWDDLNGPFEQYIEDAFQYFHSDWFMPARLNYEVEACDYGFPNATPKFYLKFWRHFQPSNMVRYDAVCIMDADMFICENIMQYFEIAHQTGRILIPRNTSIHAHQVDNYSESCFVHSYAPPCHSMPLFYDPKKYCKLFAEMPGIAQQIGRGEMVAINWLFHKEQLWDDLILLPNSLWLGTRWSDLEYKMLYGNEDKRFLTVAGDRVYSIHGRWWTEEWVGGRVERTLVGLANARLFYEMYDFLNNLYDSTGMEVK